MSADAPLPSLAPGKIIPGFDAGLSTEERLQAATLAQSFVLQIHALKIPLRRRILEEVRRLLGEE